MYHMASVNSGCASHCDHKDLSASICVAVIKLAPWYFSSKAHFTSGVKELRQGATGKKKVYQGQSKRVAKFKSIFAIKHLWWPLSPTSDSLESPHCWISHCSST